jgi:hypothetical protein
MSPRPALLLASVVILVLGVATALWLNGQYGVFAPWDPPQFLLVCARPYDLGVASSDTTTGTARVLILRPTVFDLPLIPAIQGINQALSYDGCPELVVLRSASGDRVYVPQGSP